MKPDLLLIEPMMPAIEAQLDASYNVCRLFDPVQRQMIEASCSNIRAVVTGGGTGLSNDWIDRLPNLGIVAINGVGTDKIDLPYARERGIDVTTTPGALTDDVADMALTLILALSRRIVQGDAAIRAGRWARGEGFPLGRGLGGKRLGILGLGQIGRAIGLRAEAFGMTPFYYNRSQVPDCTWTSLPDPVALASKCDVLAVCIASTASTQNIVDRSVLSALGKDGIIVNIARGAVIDEPALIAAVRDGSIAGAGLDVFIGEPTINPAFYDLPNTVLAPHQGSATIETRLRMGDIVVTSLGSHFAGKRPAATVN